MSQGLYTVIGVVIGGALASIPAIVQAIGRRSEREEEVNTYKRMIYRNFLNHAYWWRHLEDGSEKHKRHTEYTADWFRIRLMTTDHEILEAVEPLRDDIELVARVEPRLLELFAQDVGQGGLGD